MVGWVVAGRLTERAIDSTCAGSTSRALLAEIERGFVERVLAGEGDGGDGAAVHAGVDVLLKDAVEAAEGDGRAGGLGCGGGGLRKRVPLC